MKGYKKKVSGRRHSIIVDFIPLLESLETYFREENVVPRRFGSIRNTDPQLNLALKGYDHSFRAYVLQAKQSGRMQYFNIRIEEGELAGLEDFVNNYPLAGALRDPMHIPYTE